MILRVNRTPSSMVASMGSLEEECRVDSLVEASLVVDSPGEDSLVEEATSSSLVDSRCFAIDWMQSYSPSHWIASFIMYLSPHFIMYAASTAIEGCLEYTRITTKSWHGKGTPCRDMQKFLKYTWLGSLVPIAEKSYTFLVQTRLSML